MTAISTKPITIRFGHSPDPDDAFMFYAIAHRLIDLQGFEIEHVVEDIESLNRRALKGELEVTAVSVHAYAHVADKYAILRSGASMGDNYGPVVVAKSNGDSPQKKRIAVPGTLTSAYLAWKLREVTVANCRQCKNENEIVVPFDQIIDAVVAGRADYGLLIHEGQITYWDYGLRKVLDLGEWWWRETKLPLPLGIDVIRKDIPAERQKAFAKVFRDSIVYGLNHRKEALAYAAPYGRNITRQEEDRFVSMYVNHYTRDLGEKGEKAIRELLERGYEAGILPKLVEPEFV